MGRMTSYPLETFVSPIPLQISIASAMPVTHIPVYVDDNLQ